MSIRTKLLVVMAGLLVLSAGLSFFLHRREGERVRDDLEAVVHRIVERLVAQTRPGGILSPWEQRGEPSLKKLEILIPRMEFGETGWVVRLEKRVEMYWSGEDPTGLWSEEDPRGLELFPRGDMLPPETIEAVLLDDAQDPIDKARNESLPRELMIAGSVLLVGLGMVWLLTGRLTGPTKELTKKMELVARGDLNVKVQPTTQDEVRKMSLAFNTMVDRLREKRELERKMFQAERLSAMGNLAAGVAHDIRNPLNTIGLTLAHLRDRYAPEDPEKQRGFLGYMDDIRKELDRLNEIVRGFLSLAHPDRGERVSCDLGELVRECLRLFRKEAESKGVAVLRQLEDVEPIVVNPQQIRAALTNVVVNALQALAAEGGQLRVALFDRPVDGGERETVLRIADTGPGIDPAEMDKVFLPYFTTREDGTGLGLPIARGAVEANGGRLEVRSRPGEGTEVDIVLPAAAAGPAASAGAGARDIGAGSPPKGDVL